jgi:nucleotide-binding universal stress UspA family protein
MKTILVATDYSRAATNALEYAALLARHMEARLAILNTFSLSVPAAATATSLHDVHAAIVSHQQRQDQLAREVSLTYGIAVEAISKISPLDEEICRQVKRLQADLVVMGMKGESLSRKLFGSSTTTMMRQARFPLLVVPLGASFSGLRNIVLAFDYRSLTANHSLSCLRELAHHFHSRVQVLHVETEQEEPVREAKQEVKNVVTIEMLMSGLAHSFRHIEEKEVITGIQRGITEYEADLVAMVPHKKGAWYSIFSKSTTRQMALVSRVPLLVLPNRTAEGPMRVLKPAKGSLAPAGH